MNITDFQRQIKFRVWNNKDKEWLHGPNKEPSLDGINLIGENILFGNFLNEVKIEDLNDIVALQFTGLKDKNEKEIFEGDIVSVFSNTQKSQVFWEKDCGFWALYIHFSSHRDCVPEMELLSNHLKSVEVIGNIFDNPDLIKDLQS